MRIEAEFSLSRQAAKGDGIRIRGFVHEFFPIDQSIAEQRLRAVSRAYMTDDLTARVGLLFRMEKQNPFIAEYVYEAYNTMREKNPSNADAYLFGMLGGYEIFRRIVRAKKGKVPIVDQASIEVTREERAESNEWEENRRRTNFYHHEKGLAHALEEVLPLGMNSDEQNALEGFKRGIYTIASLFRTYEDRYKLKKKFT